MKKIVLLGAAAVCALVLAGCGTTDKVKGSGIKGDAAKVQTGKRVMVDYQGATLGKEVPKWMELLVEGQYSQPVLSKVMPGLEGKKVFVTTGRGDNLDFVRTWSDLVDIETEVAGTLERVAAKAVQASLAGSSSATGKDMEPTNVERTVDMYRTSLVNVRLSGLERIASYWTEIQVMDKKTVTADYYEYYAVWAMDEKLFNQQLGEALKSIPETTTEAQALKAMVSKKLQESLAISNDSAVTDEADEFIVYERIN